MVTGGNTTTFTYDGDGHLVKRTGPEGTTLYVGRHYEGFTAAGTPAPPMTFTKYYFLGSRRVAKRIGTGGTVTYFYQDLLGSTVGQPRRWQHEHSLLALRHHAHGEHGRHRLPLHRPAPGWHRLVPDGG